MRKNNYIMFLKLANLYNKCVILFKIILLATVLIRILYALVKEAVLLWARGAQGNGMGSIMSSVYLSMRPGCDVTRTCTSPVPTPAPSELAQLMKRSRQTRPGINVLHIYTNNAESVCQEPRFVSLMNVIFEWICSFYF